MLGNVKSVMNANLAFVYELLKSFYRKKFVVGYL